MALGFAGAIDDLIVAIRADVADFERGIRDATNGVKKFDRDVKGAVGGVKRMEGALNSLRTVAAGLGVGLGAAAIGAAFRKSAVAAADFESRMSSISTLLSDTSGVDQLADSLDNLSTQFGLPVVEQAAGLYEIMAAGVEDAAKAMEILTVSNKLAIGGVTSVATAADALTSIVAVYGDAAGGAAAASDALFVAAAAGKTSIEELANGFGRVAPLAASMNISLEEALAVIGALTASMESAEAFTGFRSILAGIAKPTQEAADEAKRLGIEFNIAALQAQGFQQFMANLVRVTGGSAESLTKLFGRIEAVVPVLNLAGEGGDRLAKVLDDMANKAGRSEKAFGQFADDAQFAFNRANQEAAKAFRDLGKQINASLAPVARDLAANFDDVKLAVESLTRAVAAGAIAWVGYRTVVAAIAIENVVRGFVALTAQLRLSTVALIGLNTGIRALWVALGPVGLAVTAIGALATALFLVKKRANEAAEEGRRMLDVFRQGLGIENIATLELKRQTGQLQQIKRLEEIQRLEREIADIQRSGFDPDLQASLLQKPLKALKELQAAERKYVEEAVELELELNRRRREAAAVPPAPPPPELPPPPKIPSAVGDSFKELREQVDATFTRLEFFEAKMKDLATLRISGIELDIVGGQIFTEVQRLETAFAKIGTRLEANRAEFAKIGDVARSAAEGERRRAELLSEQAELMEQQLRIAERLRDLTPQVDLTFLPTVEVEDPFGDLGTKGKKTTEELNAAALASRRLATQFQAASVAGRGLIQIADSMGRLDDATRRVLDGVLGLVDAFGELARARELAAEAEALTGAGDTAGASAANLGALVAQVGGIIGAIGGFVSIVSGLFDKTPAQQERERILKQNTDTLERLRLTMEGFIITAASTLGAGKSLGQVLATEIGRNLAALAGAGAPFSREARAGFLKDFDAQLRAAGTSLKELQAFAEANGIEILDSKGRLVAGALEQLEEALRLAAVEAATFGNSVREQATILDARADIFDLDTSPVSEAQRAIDFLGENLGGSVARMFQGIDVSTEEGRKAAQDAIERVFGFIDPSNFATGVGAFGLDPSLLGQFETIEEFLDFLLKADNALDGFAETLDATTSALRNVPDSFKVASARFRAETPVPSTSPFITDDGFNPLTGFGGLAGVTITGDVYVDARTKPVDQALAELTSAQKRKAQIKTGTTADPWGVS